MAPVSFAKQLDAVRGGAGFGAGVAVVGAGEGTPKEGGGAIDPVSA